MSKDKFIRGKRCKELSQQSQAYKEFYNMLTYVRVPTVFYQLMKPEEAQILAYLWNLRQMLEETNELDDGWFYCTLERLEKALGYKRRVQDRVFKALIAMKLIKTEVKGLPSKRFVRVNRKRIKEVCLRWHELSDQAGVIAELNSLAGR